MKQTKCVAVIEKSELYSELSGLVILLRLESNPERSHCTSKYTRLIYWWLKKQRTANSRMESLEWREEKKHIVREEMEMSVPGMMPVIIWSGLMGRGNGSNERYASNHSFSCSICKPNKRIEQCIRAKGKGGVKWWYIKLSWFPSNLLSLSLSLSLARHPPSAYTKTRSKTQTLSLPSSFGFYQRPAAYCTCLQGRWLAVSVGQSRQAAADHFLSVKRVCSNTESIQYIYIYIYGYGAFISYLSKLCNKLIKNILIAPTIGLLLRSAEKGENVSKNLM